MKPTRPFSAYADYLQYGTPVRKTLWQRIKEAFGGR